MNFSIDLHNILPLVIFLVVLPLSLYLGYRRGQAERKKLRDVASKLGLQYSEQAPGRPSLDALAIRSGDPQRTQQRLRQLDRDGALTRMLKSLAPPAVTGKYNGFAVDIRTQRSDKKTYTVFTVSFPGPLGLGLKATSNNFFRRSFGAPSGQRIEAGDEAFDKAVFVKGDDQMKVKYLVKRPEVRKALLDSYRAQPDTVIDDNAIVCRVQKGLPDWMAYQKVLTDLTMAAKQLASG